MRSLTVLVVLAIGLTACGGSVDPRSHGGGSTTVTESEVQVTIPATTPATNPMTSTTADPEIEQAAEELEEALGELESLLDDLESLLEDPVD